MNCQFTLKLASKSPGRVVGSHSPSHLLTGHCLVAQGNDGGFVEKKGADSTSPEDVSEHH